MRAAVVLLMLALGCGGAATRPPPPPVAKPEPAPDPVTKPAGYVEVRVLDVLGSSFGEGDTLLLVDDVSNVVLPISIGGTEGSSIEARVRGTPRRRPLTHDLMDAAVRKLGGEIVKVHVDELRDGVFHGSIYIRNAQNRIVRLDSRASDAVALGIGNGVPIYVAKAVLDEAGIDRDKVMPQISPTGPIT